MGKKLFFISLLVLSLAMGRNWYKNRPKTEPKRPVKTRTAVNLDDLKLTPDPEEIPPETESGVPEKPADEGDPDDQNPDELDPNEVDPEVPPVASASAELDDDPVIAAFKSMKRDPFESSPFEQMLVEARIKKPPVPENQQELASRTTTVLSAPFAGTIETETELLAIIDKRLYREGDDFQGKKIVKIESKIVTLENPIGVFLMPKTGVKINLSPDGTFSYTDDFYKYNN